MDFTSRYQNCVHLSIIYFTKCELKLIREQLRESCCFMVSENLAAYEGATNYNFEGLIALMYKSRGTVYYRLTNSARRKFIECLAGILGKE